MRRTNDAFVTGLDSLGRRVLLRGDKASGSAWVLADDSIFVATPAGDLLLLAGDTILFFGLGLLWSLLLLFHVSLPHGDVAITIVFGGR